ncbi:MAG: hypothetical protein JNM33_15095 [Rubrivivax sp.]|nr:hypothetical protein [Rubrivivax sp.]
MTKALTKTKARADLAPAVPPLTDQQLEVVRALATEGTTLPTIRRALGLHPKAWATLMQDAPDGSLSPLNLALQDGRAAGVDSLVSFFKSRMRDGDVRAAEWLGDRVFRVGKEDGAAEQPRVSIVINAAMSPDEYRRMIEVSSS